MANHRIVVRVARADHIARVTPGQSNFMVSTGAFGRETTKFLEQGFE